MTIEQILLLEPNLKSSIRKYQAVGKTGLLNGRPCSFDRLSIEISETVKCYCEWSEHKELYTDEAVAFLINYLVDLCPNINHEMAVKSNG